MLWFSRCSAGHDRNIFWSVGKDALPLWYGGSWKSFTKVTYPLGSRAARRWGSSPHARTKMCWWKMQHRKHRTKARCFHIFIVTFQFKKLEKHVSSDNEFLTATGDILEMQQGIFMNWCDSNARALKKNKPTGHWSLLPHREQIGGLFSLLRCLCCFCFACVSFPGGIGNSFLVTFRV